MVPGEDDLSEDDLSEDGGGEDKRDNNNIDPALISLQEEYQECQVNCSIDPEPMQVDSDDFPAPMQVNSNDFLAPMQVDSNFNRPNNRHDDKQRNDCVLDRPAKRRRRDPVKQEEETGLLKAEGGCNAVEVPSKRVEASDVV